MEWDTKNVQYRQIFEIKIRKVLPNISKIRIHINFFAILIAFLCEVLDIHAQIWVCINNLNTPQIAVRLQKG